MKTTEQILTEMILKEKKANELQDKYIQKMENEIAKKISQQEITLDLIKMVIKKTKKITLILSIATILNSISIIILNFWK